jgi:hypothetical protein
MAVVRWGLLVLLVAAAVCFALFAGTGNPKYKKLGIALFKWTMLAALGFFAVLFLERVFS